MPPEQSRIRVYARCVLVAAAVLVACREPTSPAGTLSVILTPDTVHQQRFDREVMRLVIRNDLPYTVRMDDDGAFAQVETAPGVWQVFAGGGGYFMVDSPSAYDIESGEQDASPGSPYTAGHFPDIRGMPPGRYRLAYTYWRVNADGTTNESNANEAYSNVMTIVP